MGLYEDSKTGHKFSGAGVLIVENYKTKTGQIVPCILVVKNKAAQTLSDFGGGYSAKHKELTKTAEIELLEESKNLIHIPDSKIKDAEFIDIDANRNTKYRTYVLKVSNISTKYFNHNRDVIDSDSRSTRYWKETESIHHIPIENIDFDNLLNKGSVYFQDTQQNEIKVSMRLRKILRESKQTLLDVLRTESVLSKKNLIQVESDDFKNGTFSFKKLNI